MGRNPQLLRRRALPVFQANDEDGYHERAHREKDQEPRPPFAWRLNPVDEEGHRCLARRDGHDAEHERNDVPLQCLRDLRRLQVEDVSRAAIGGIYGDGARRDDDGDLICLSVGRKWPFVEFGTYEGDQDAPVIPP